MAAFRPHSWPFPGARGAAYRHLSPAAAAPSALTPHTALRCCCGRRWAVTVRRSWRGGCTGQERPGCSQLEQLVGSRSSGRKLTATSALLWPQPACQQPCRPCRCLSVGSGWRDSHASRTALRRSHQQLVFICRHRNPCILRAGTQQAGCTGDWLACTRTVFGTSAGRPAVTLNPTHHPQQPSVTLIPLHAPCAPLALTIADGCAAALPLPTPLSHPHPHFSPSPAG